MRRLASHVFSALSALSLVVCVAALAVQVEVLLDRDRYERLIPFQVTLPFGTSLYLRDGFCVRSEHEYHYEEFTTGRSTGIVPSTTLYHLRLEILERLGFGFQIDRWTSGPFAGWSITLPFWFVIAATVVPATRFVRRVTRAVRARDRRRRSLCPACGYDLRATPGRCPECGADGTRTAV